MRRMLVLALILVLVAVSTLPAVAQQAGSQWKPEVKFIKIGVSSAGGDWFRAGAKFSTIIPTVFPEVAASTVIGGGVVNVTRIGKGETQIGFALTPYPEQGYKGETKNYPAPLKNVRLIASNLGRHVVVAMVVLKDSPIKSINDLKGKRIVPGDRGWGTTELVEALLATNGTSVDKFKADGGTISYTSITDRSKALQDKNVDAIFIPAQVNFPDLMAVQQAAGIRVIGFPNDVVEKTLATMPGLVKSKVPKGLYGVVDQDLASPGFLQQLIVDAGLSDELVYRITKLWWERIKEIHEIAPGLDQANVKLAMENATIPFHPGALRYYKEVGVAR
ncbi:MAG: TAXI family TRAP transporter solute-binding subunit [Candidatus Rokubacteria bacterium]|nr:TAXI family TRAP transporter solute-binding subunit [Candidatus Rokubacteria bacterium]